MNPRELKEGDSVYFPKAATRKKRLVCWYVHRVWDGKQITVKSWVFSKGWYYFQVDQSVIDMVGLTDRRPAE